MQHYYIVALALHLMERVTAVNVLAGELMYYRLYLQDTSKQLAQMQKLIQQAKAKQAKGKQIPATKPSCERSCHSAQHHRHTLTTTHPRTQGLP